MLAANGSVVVVLTLQSTGYGDHTVTICAIHWPTYTYVYAQLRQKATQKVAMHCFAAYAAGPCKCFEPGLVAVAVAAACTARCGAQLFSQQLPAAVVVIVVLFVVFIIAASVSVALVVLPFTFVVMTDSCLWLCWQLCVSTAGAACGNSGCNYGLC